MIAASAATPGFWDWSVDPALELLILAGLLYRAGDTARLAPARVRAERRWQSVCFYCGLAVVAVALNSPLEALSRSLFWAHMVQHVLLLLVAPPLIVLARPWIRLWRALPLRWRRPLARSLGLGRRTSWLRRIGRALGRPLPSFVLFCGVLLTWHVPALFDATLRSEPLHVLEHGLFFATALMFWKQVIHSPPLRARLAAAQRIAYLVGAMVVSWGLAIVLALAPHPLYAPYVHEASRPGGLSALADQQLAAGVMWVPGSITFVIVIFVYVHRWLMPPAPGPTRAPGLASEH
jgi:cytochrome c oxidase assembly factor CtaG